MTIKTLFLMSIILISGTQSQPAARTRSGTTTPDAFGRARLPDLIVEWSRVETPGNGEFNIRIKNQGKAAARASYVVIEVYHVASPGAAQKVMTFRARVPALAAGKTADVVIKTKLQLSLDANCTIADGTNVIKESDEKNNRVCT